MDRIKAGKLFEELVSKELEMAGKTVEEAKQTPEWYHKFSLNKEQQEEFRDYAIKRIMKVLRYNRKMAESEFAWFNLGYGLREV
jgi:hypothetical protein